MHLPNSPDIRRDVLEQFRFQRSPLRGNCNKVATHSITPAAASNDPTIPLVDLCNGKISGPERPKASPPVSLIS